jgi:hypothetical protein
MDPHEREALESRIEEIAAEMNQLQGTNPTDLEQAKMRRQLSAEYVELTHKLADEHQRQVPRRK